jgi:hypothetical protein
MKVYEVWDTQDKVVDRAGATLFTHSEDAVQAAISHATLNHPDQELQPFYISECKTFYKAEMIDADKPINETFYNGQYKIRIRYLDRETLV